MTDFVPDFDSIYTDIQLDAVELAEGGADTDAGSTDSPPPVSADPPPEPDPFLSGADDAVGPAPPSGLEADIPLPNPFRAGVAGVGAFASAVRAHRTRKAKRQGDGSSTEPRQS